MQFPSYLFSENAPRKTQETLILNSFWMSMPPSSLDIYFSFLHAPSKSHATPPGLEEDLNLSKKSE